MDRNNKPGNTDTATNTSQDTTNTQGQGNAAPAKPLRGFARNPQLAAAAGRKGGMSVPPHERSFSKNPELARQAGRKGGMSVAPSERSFSKNPQLAREAGRKGGMSVPPEERSFSKNPELAREAGRKGGSASGSRRAAGMGRKPGMDEGTEGQIQGETVENQPETTTEQGDGTGGSDKGQG